MTTKKEIPMPTEADIQRINKRYFIVFFVASYEGVIFCNSSVNVECKGFPNCEETIRLICEIHDATGCTISNIKELTKSDFADWDAVSDE